MKNLQVGTLCPFNTVVDYQRLASALVMSESSPPSTIISTDGQTVTHKEHTLHVPTWIAGLHSVHDLTINLMSKLCRGQTIELNLDQAIQDDWTNVIRGYSWLDNASYVNGNRPLLKILMADKDLHLATVDRNGRLQYNTAAMHEIMADAAHINKHIAFLAFTTSGQPSRMSEFADHKIRNSIRPRTVLAHGQDLWLVIRRVKFENLIHHEVFVPMKLHSQLSDLMRFYLLVIRPLEVELAWLLWGEETSHLYEEYLWLHMGERMMEQQLGKNLESFTGRYCGTGLSPRPYRHIVVGIARTYLGSEFEIDEDEDDVLARQACHGPKTRARIYAPEHGHLPSMSSDMLLRFGHVSEAWWKLTRFLPGAVPLLPLKERRSIQQECQSRTGVVTADTAQTTVQEATLDTSKIIKYLTASMTTTMNTMQMEMKTQIQEGIATGIAEVLRRQNRPLSTSGANSHTHPINTTWIPHNLDDLYLPTVVPEPTSQTSLSANKSSSKAACQQSHINGSNTLDILLHHFFPTNPNVQFKSIEQRDMTALAVSREHNFIGILATGGGKSLVFMLPTLQEEGFFTVVLIPNKMLLRDMIRKAEEAHIPCMQWTTSSENPTQEKLLFVALETATHTKFLM